MKRLVELASGEQRRILEAAATLARERALAVWLVGGPVRDALLGRRFADLDFTLEREADAFASELARRVGGTLTRFPSFLTFRIVLPSGAELDVATAREEHYERPGALPTVRAGTLEDDLRRRDATVNAMAVEIVSGELADPFGGRADLEARLMRVLHDRSFSDDPTRIFRLIRLAVRLGFDLEPRTLELLRRAVDRGALESVSRERRWRELRLAFGEECAAAVAEELARAGALDALLGPLRAPNERRSALDRAERIADSDPRLDREILFLSALLPGGPGAGLPLEGSGWSAPRIAVLRELLRAGEIAEELARAGEGERVARLERASGELLALLREHASLRGAVELERRFRDTRLPFSAEALGVEPGPHVGRALRETRRALAAGTLDPDRAIAFARQRAEEYLRSG